MSINQNPHHYSTHIDHVGIARLFKYYRALRSLAEVVSLGKVPGTGTLTPCEAPIQFYEDEESRTEFLSFYYEGMRVATLITKNGRYRPDRSMCRDGAADWILGELVPVRRSGMMLSGS